MHHTHHQTRPFLKDTFIRLAAAGAILLVLLDAALYYYLDKRTFDFARDSVQAIAVNVASNVPASLHESLKEPKQQNSDEYKVVENYFQIVMDANPRIDDVYTMRSTSDPSIVTFVVSGAVDEDENGDNVIESHELKPKLGETYDASDQPDLIAAFTEGPTADSKITYDKWGAWISGYAPIKDGSGNVVAIVGVDAAAKYITDQRLQIVQSIIIIDLIAFPILFLTSYFVARRITREFQILAEGMDQLAHGNIDYELPLNYKGRGGVFKMLFHDMVAMFKNLQSEGNEKKDGGKK